MDAMTADDKLNPEALDAARKALYPWTPPTDLMEAAILAYRKVDNGWRGMESACDHHFVRAINLPGLPACIKCGAVLKLEDRPPSGVPGGEGGEAAIRSYDATQLPSPPNPAAGGEGLLPCPRPCDDKRLIDDLIDCIGKARTTDGRLMVDLFTFKDLQNVALQITEGSNILDDLLIRHGAAPWNRRPTAPAHGLSAFLRHVAASADRHPFASTKFIEAADALDALSRPVDAGGAIAGWDARRKLWPSRTEAWDMIEAGDKLAAALASVNTQSRRAEYMEDEAAGAVDRAVAAEARAEALQARLDKAEGVGGESAAIRGAAKQAWREAGSLRATFAKPASLPPSAEG